MAWWVREFLPLAFVGFFFAGFLTAVALIAAIERSAANRRDDGEGEP